MNHYCIIGTGAAGLMAAQTIRTHDKDGAITLITEEGYPPYYRPGLPEVLGNKKSLDELMLRPAQWYESKRISLRTDTRIDRIDTGKKLLHTGAGHTITYDRLLLACGGYPFIPPIQGCDSPFVFTIRSAADINRLAEYMASVRHLAVIGGGLLGLEAAHSLAQPGKDITIIEQCDRLLPKQLDPTASALLQKDLESRGFTFILDDKVTQIETRDECTAITLDGTPQRSPDGVLICVGIRPRTELARDAGICVQNGVVVDEWLQTDAADIWCAGDMAEFNGQCGGLWSIAMQQGKTAGATMADHATRYTGMTPETSLKVTGIDLFSSGTYDCPGGSKKSYMHNDVYRALFLDAQQRAVGCILFGDTTNKTKVSQCVKGNIRVSGDVDDIMDPAFDRWDAVSP